MRVNSKYVSIEIDQVNNKNHFLLEHNNGRSASDSTYSDHSDGAVMATINEENNEPLYDITEEKTSSDNTKDRPYYENVGLHTKTRQTRLTRSTDDLLSNTNALTIPVLHTPQTRLTRSTEDLLSSSNTSLIKTAAFPHYENIGNHKKRNNSYDHSYANYTITPAGSMDNLIVHDYANCTITPTRSLDNLTAHEYANRIITPTGSLVNIHTHDYANCIITPTTSLNNLTTHDYANCTITPTTSLNNLTAHDYANCTMTTSMDNLTTHDYAKCTITPTTSMDQLTEHGSLNTDTIDKSKKQ